MNRDDPQYKGKTADLPFPLRTQKFKVVANLSSKSTKNLIGYCRYIVAELPDAMKIASIKMSTFKAGEFYGYLPKISLGNEIAVWKHIKYVVHEALELYPETLKEDI